MKDYLSINSVLFSGQNCNEAKQYVRAWGICCQLLGLQDVNKDIRISLNQQYAQRGEIPIHQKTVSLANPNTVICLDTPFIASYCSPFRDELFIAMLRSEVDVLPSFSIYDSMEDYNKAIEKCFRELEKELFLPTSILSIVSPLGESGFMACIIGCVLSDNPSGDQT